MINTIPPDQPAGSVTGETKVIFTFYWLLNKRCEGLDFVVAVKP